MTELTVKDKTAQIMSFILYTIPTILRTKPTMSIAEYMRRCKIPLNLQIISILIGANIINGKRRNRLEFGNDLPTVAEVNKLITIYKQYTDYIETPLIATCSGGAASVKDDMKIIGKGFKSKRYKNSNVIKFNDINEKLITDYVFGYNGYPPLSGCKLKHNDIMHIYDFGKQLRHQRRVKTGIKIGLGLAGLGLVGYGIYKICSNSKKKVKHYHPQLKDNDYTEDDDYVNVEYKEDSAPCALHS